MAHVQTRTSFAVAAIAATMAGRAALEVDPPAPYGPVPGARQPRWGHEREL